MSRDKLLIKRTRQSRSNVKRFETEVQKAEQELALAKEKLKKAKASLRYHKKELTRNLDDVRVYCGDGPYEDLIMTSD